MEVHCPSGACSFWPCSDPAPKRRAIVGCPSGTLRPRHCVLGVGVVGMPAPALNSAPVRLRNSLLGAWFDTLSAVFGSHRGERLKLVVDRGRLRAALVLRNRSRRDVRVGPRVGRRRPRTSSTWRTCGGCSGHWEIPKIAFPPCWLQEQTARARRLGRLPQSCRLQG